MYIMLNDVQGKIEGQRKYHLSDSSPSGNGHKTETSSINPARAFVCGDEKKDFEAAIASGCHPFMVYYGFEDFERLTMKIGVPPEIISRSPSELRDRISHTLDS
jgi:phosphoglycolate phosphatase-like HAD superfamily hydrolase